MITVDARKLAKAIKTLQGKRKKLADTADGIYRQKLYYLAEAAARVSPQFSGDFASNWNLAVEGNMPVYRAWPGKYSPDVVAEGEGRNTRYRIQPHKAGDPEAIGASLARIAGQLRGVTRHMRVHLVNATELYTPDGKRMVGPDGAVNLRDENLIPGGQRIESYLRALAKDL